MTPDAVRAAEMLAPRTRPSREQEAHGNWLLRTADGYSRRANSVLAIGEPPDGIPAALDRLNAWFRAREVEPCERIAPLAPASLDRGHAHPHDVVVDPALRGKGLGKRLMRQILSGLRAEGARDATLQVLESNGVARSLYRRFGCVEVHRYHSGSPRAARTRPPPAAVEAVSRRTPPTSHRRGPLVDVIPRATEE